MKKCSSCGDLKLLDEFNKRSGASDGRQDRCRSCTNLHNRRYYHANRDKLTKQINSARNARSATVTRFLRKIKSLNGCSVCGEDCPFCLDFHHLGEKSFLISSHSRAVGVETLLAEVGKCSCLCANCHRKLHNNCLDLTFVRPCYIPSEGSCPEADAFYAIPLRGG